MQGNRLRHRDAPRDDQELRGQRCQPAALLRFQVRARFRLNSQKVTGPRVEQDDIADNRLPADPDRHLQRGHRPARIRQRRRVQAVGERQVEDGVDRYEPGFHPCLPGVRYRQDHTGREWGSACLDSARRERRIRRAVP